MKPLSSSEIRSFRNTIYRWYNQHRRDFPWRNNGTPYRVLVSEIMLQQTQVERVQELFPRFIRQFPSMRSLARASLGEVIIAWRGMGYNRRAKYLWETARIVCEQYGGRLPSDPDLLRQLPGIGKGTAGSIVAFAFNKPVAFVETNIRRVIIHHWFNDKTQIPEDSIERVAEQVLDSNNPREWYSALMDYGSMLKKTAGNANVRSAYYKQQSSFEGSVRQVRGAIIALLVQEQVVNRATINKLPYERKLITTALDALMREGMVIQKKRMYQIPIF